jgi:beta-N-acetylhexosaminidase
MKILTSLLMMLALIGCNGNTAMPANEEDNSDTIIEYTLDEDIGEMLLVGFRGVALDSTNHIWRDLKHYHVGSVILFDYDAPSGKRGRNITGVQQVQNLCRQLRLINPDLLIGIDQEGGLVSRLHPRYGFPQVGAPQRSATIGYDSVRSCASITAQMLYDVGINLNFAPVADVDVNPDCPVIGKMGRSFSPSPEHVTDCCRIWIEEQNKKGVASCMKHFPGHGSATGDTHKGLVDVSGTWKELELMPYEKLVKEVPMVMTAHVINRQLDPDGLPASLSPRITAYLRDTLGFQGVIVTDDLAMGAIVNEYSFETTLKMAIEAGADMLCLSNNGGTYDREMVSKAVRIIKKLVADGTISAERIHTSAERVRALKAKLQ